MWNITESELLSANEMSCCPYKVTALTLIKAMPCLSPQELQGLNLSKAEEPSFNSDRERELTFVRVLYFQYR